MTKMHNIGISTDDLNNILGILKKNQKISEVILFGSRAKGTYESGSDIDIALKGNNLVLNDILDISIALDELLLPYKFDLIIYDKEKDLLEHISGTGIPLFTRKQSGHNIPDNASERYNTGVK